MKCIYELILGNYARCTYLLQSPRSGKFVSNDPDVEKVGFKINSTVSIP